MEYLLDGVKVLLFLWFLGWIRVICLGMGWVSIGLKEGCLDYFCCFWECERSNVKRERSWYFVMGLRLES